jgi:hypothetical protein
LNELSYKGEGNFVSPAILLNICDAEQDYVDAKAIKGAVWGWSEQRDRASAE